MCLHDARSKKGLNHCCCVYLKEYFRYLHSFVDYSQEKERRPLMPKTAIWVRFPVTFLVCIRIRDLVGSAADQSQSPARRPSASFTYFCFYCLEYAHSLARRRGIWNVRIPHFPGNVILTVTNSCLIIAAYL